MYDQNRTSKTTYLIRCIVGLFLLNREKICYNIRKIQKKDHATASMLAKISLIFLKNDIEIRSLLAYSLLETRKIEASRRFCTQLIKDGANDQFIELIIGWTYIRSMQEGYLHYADDARHHLEKVVGNRYRHRAERGLSVVHLLTGNHELALHLAERAYDHCPTPKYRAWLEKMTLQRNAARDRSSVEDHLGDSGCGSL